MSGVKRTEDLHSIKTRSFILQNADNTFPPKNSILGTVDSRGHIEAINNLNVNSLIINNDRAIIDSSGSILAHSITLDSSGIAMVTAGDIYVTNANIYNTGNQDSTGFIQTTYLTLLDPSANNPNTYLYANSGSLLWHNDALDQTYNISQGIESLAIDPNYFFRLLNPQGDTYLYETINNLLKLLSNKQIFLALEGSEPPPPIPTVTTLNAYTVIFHSKCGVIIRIILSDGTPVPGVGDFDFYGNPNSGTMQFTITNLCNNLNNLTNEEGSLLSEYVTFTYNTNMSFPYCVTMTVKDPAAHGVVFLDMTRVGEAKRFLNHLLFTNQKWSKPTIPTPSNYPFGPSFSTLLTIPPPFPPGDQDKTMYIDYAVTNSITGFPFASLLKYPNNDKALQSPRFAADLSGTGLIIVTITHPPNVSGLTPRVDYAKGYGNQIQSYGVYLNGNPIWLQPVDDKVAPQPMTFNVTGVFKLAAKNYLSVTSIDIYNETIRPRKVELF